MTIPLKNPIKRSEVGDEASQKWADLPEPTNVAGFTPGALPRSWLDFPLPGLIFPQENHQQNWDLDMGVSENVV